MLHNAEAPRAPTTRYQKSIRTAPAKPASSGLFVLKDAKSNAKLGGGNFNKGPFVGMRLYSLTLIERATCWPGCQNWQICYGDRMPFATRYEAGPELERDIELDVRRLSERHLSGFVVRLHVLGDFYSVGYVDLWDRLVQAFPPLHIYGYTHYRYSSPIGRRVTDFVLAHPGRVSILRSDADEADDPLPRAMTIPVGAPAAAGTVICPEQLDRTASCVNCGLCMNGHTSVSFIDHGQGAERRALPVVA